MGKPWRTVLSLALPVKGRVGWGWCFVVCCVVAITDSRPCAFSSAILAAESLLFACPKRSNQEKGTLGVAPSLRDGSLRATGVLPTVHPWTAAKAARSLAPPRAKRGPDPSALRRGTEGPSQEKSGAGVPAFAAAYGSGSDSLVIPRLLRPGRPRSALTGFPLGRGEDRRKKPEGARARCARVRCRHMDGRQRTSGASSL